MLLSPKALKLKPRIRTRLKFPGVEVRFGAHQGGVPQKAVCEEWIWDSF